MACGFEEVALELLERGANPNAHDGFTGWVTMLLPSPSFPHLIMSYVDFAPLGRCLTSSSLNVSP